MCTKGLIGETHKSNTTSNDQAEGGDAVGRGSTSCVWDGASSWCRWGSTAGGGNRWGGNTGGGIAAGASVDGDDTGMLLAG